jgi:Domain of Unknown Function with PDB structure (DUF3857)/Protein of unknown function (DUF2569)/Transglutaminase-like superfamily
LPGTSTAFNLAQCRKNQFEFQAGLNMPGLTTLLKTHIFHLNRLVPILISVCAGLRVIAAQQQDFIIEPVPNWASSIDVKEYNNPLEKEANSGVFCLLLDVEINGGTQERFIHIANKFLTSGGVEENSRLSFNFDPSYQQLILHKIVIHRGNDVLDQLDLSKIRVIQQEKDLDRLIYNGAKTAFLFLEDVRVGDWVEYAYTIRGRNPIEDGHFFDSLQLRWAFPIQTENYRFLWPKASQPLWVQFCGDAPKNRKITDRSYEYYWHWENRSGQEMEEFVPPSTVQYTLVHFSDFKTWMDVANWASKSFDPTNVSEELYQKVMAWRNEKITDEQRVVKALQFVQDNIRYLGIENGVNSHQPTDPSVVFARGYGDCKDKALLFCTILRFFDVDAVPVLVSTSFRQGIKGFIPTPLPFDHVIVQVVLDGETNYVDTTRPSQRGLLDRRFIDFYGEGLPLDENSTGLIRIPATNAGLPKSIEDENFDVSTNGATELTVTSTFEGRDADFTRQELAAVSRDTLEKNLLAYHKKYYADIVATKAPEIHDDEELNRIQMVGHYFIPNIWKPAAQTNFITCEFASPGIMSRLFAPLKMERKWPLAVSYPENFTHRIQIETHEPWRIIPVEKKIQTKAFLFYSKTACTNNRVTIIGQLLTFNNEIAAVDIPEYLSDIDQIPHYLGFAVTKPVPGVGQDSSPNWSIWMGAVSYSVILLFVAAMIYRYKPKSPPEISLPFDPKLNGLGGWLILLGIGLIVGILVHVGILIKNGHVYSVQNWRAYTDPANATYNALTAPLLLFELFTQLTFLFFGILLVVLFFQKRRIFPVLLIIFLSFQFIAITLDQGLAQTLKVKGVITNTHATPIPPVGQALTPLIIWSLYLTRSKRVKLTFQN